MNGTERIPVTVIGLGPMGQAMTRVLMAAGHPVTVWNRTAARADALVAEGATRAPTASDALQASRLVVVSLTDYQAMYDILDGATNQLRGRTIVNLSSESPARTREAASWTAGHGAELLAGGVMVPPPMVGTPAAAVYYSGARERFEQYRDVLALIGAPRYLGEEPELAQWMYLAQLDVFLTAIAAVEHATALLRSIGFPSGDATAALLDMLSSTADMMGAEEELDVEPDAGEREADQRAAIMMGATADHIVLATEEAGVDPALPHAVQEHFRRAIASGRGRDTWTSPRGAISA